ALNERLPEVGEADSGGAAEFEENTLYTGPGLEGGGRVLRLRRVGSRAILTYKQRGSSTSAIKRQLEEETEVKDPEALAAILEALGYRPALVYEKRRATWRVGGAEVVLDELPFGLFAEIEGEEGEILAAEKLLRLEAVEAVHETYPDLTARHGARIGAALEARFSKGG
ncbi:MAG: class IV adenylate cyclase, partial [Pyrinomonadaceae bacterium]